MGLFDFTQEMIETVEHWDGTIGAPSARNRKTNRIRVFENHIIEDWFAVSHPILPGVWFGWIVIVGLFMAVTSTRVGPFAGLALFTAGVLGWTLLEYALHRWVFHWNPGDEFDAKARLFLLHGYHHEFPNDKWRLVAPPVMSWPIAVLVGLGYWLAAGPELWWMLFGGTCAGYLAYDWVHYYTHHFSPKWPLGKMLRRAHMVHHFKLFDLNMGISSPLWDWILGSYAWSEDAVREALEEAKDAA